jgi:hypothetical protein
MNWHGRPLDSHQVIVELIGATTTQTGLRVRAEPDRGEWNPTIQPAQLAEAQPPPTARSSTTTLQTWR